MTHRQKFSTQKISDRKSGKRIAPMNGGSQLYKTGWLQLCTFSMVEYYRKPFYNFFFFLSNAIWLERIFFLFGSTTQHQLYFFHCLDHLFGVRQLVEELSFVIILNIEWNIYLFFCLYIYYIIVQYIFNEIFSSVNIFTYSRDSQHDLCL